MHLFATHAACDIPGPQEPAPRIVINGKPQYLKNERTVDWVRTLLLAGLRSAMLWQQMGGGRFELMFGRKKIMREAESLLMN